MLKNRKPTDDELVLIAYLIQASQLHLPKDWMPNLLVRDLDDGGMGSLSFVLPSTVGKAQIFGSDAAEIRFLDEDDVVVYARINLDQDGELYELDVWKTDFSPLISYHNALEIIRSS
jgi:hypothetical protein